MIKLHKLFFLFAAVAAFTACSSSEEANGTDDSLLSNAPQTEVYMGVDVLNNYQKVNANTCCQSSVSNRQCQLFQCKGRPTPWF